MDDIIAIIGNITGWLSDIYNSIVNNFAKLISDSTNSLDSVVNQIKQHTTTLINNQTNKITTFIEQQIRIVNNLLLEVGENIEKEVQTNREHIAKMSKLLSDTKALLTNKITTVHTALTQGFNDTFDRLNRMEKAILDKVDIEVESLTTHIEDLGENMVKEFETTRLVIAEDISRQTLHLDSRFNQMKYTVEENFRVQNEQIEQAFKITNDLIFESLDQTLDSIQRAEDNLKAEMDANVEEIKDHFSETIVDLIEVWQHTMADLLDLLTRYFYPPPQPLGGLLLPEPELPEPELE